ncbi:MAG TPA: amidase family protein, partial [Paracoccaceae bacterium]|nr:amidase family protein [Paracoccaceae bacterium]
MDLCSLSASDLSRMIAARKVAPSEVVDAHLARIAAVNPAVNALVSLRDPDAVLAEARAMDAAPRRGWLHGLPVAVKDLVHVARRAPPTGAPP